MCVCERKIQVESHRKGREVIRWGPVPLGGVTKEEGDYRGLEILTGK